MASGGGPNSSRALEVKLTLEINSLTRRLNLGRNVSLRLKPTKLFPQDFSGGDCCSRA
jgi:hypothetical protein